MWSHSQPPPAAVQAALPCACYVWLCVCAVEQLSLVPLSPPEPSFYTERERHNVHVHVCSWLHVNLVYMYIPHRDWSEAHYNLYLSSEDVPLDSIRYIRGNQETSVNI